MIKITMNRGLVDSNNPASVFADALGEKARLEGLWAEQRFAKGKAIFRQDAELDHFFVLTSGLVKLVYATPNGDMWVKSLIVDKGIFGASSPDAVGAVNFSAEATEDSWIATLPLAWIRDAIDNDADIKRRYGAFIDWVRLRKEAREADLLCKSAEERYRDLLANDAALLSRLSQGDIARYLRITPIAFSRIKRRMS